MVFRCILSVCFFFFHLSWFRLECGPTLGAVKMCCYFLCWQKGSPLREPLMKFLIRYPIDTINLFLSDAVLKDQQYGRFLVVSAISCLLRTDMDLFDFLQPYAPTHQRPPPPPPCSYQTIYGPPLKPRPLLPLMLRQKHLVIGLFVTVRWPICLEQFGSDAQLFWFSFLFESCSQNQCVQNPALLSFLSLPQLSSCCS